MNLGWYKRSYRRNLVDMHIEDWNDEFLSKLNADDYLDCLKRGKIKSAMIYFQNHNGHCYFPTRVGHIHEKFTGEKNEIKRLVDLCHENDIDVVGYYSVIFNTYEEDRHPEWRLIGYDGLTRRQRFTAKCDHGSLRRKGLCCPNNPEYREFVKIQIKEMLDYFGDIEGMFYDMTFWPEICTCDNCKARAKAELGLEGIPKVDWKDKDFKRFMTRRHEWMGEFAHFVSDYTRELRPGITVEHNYAQSVAGDEYSSNTELVNDACDFTGGDLYGSLYNHSFAAKYYRGVTRNAPVEYMTCRCDNNLSQHTVTKSERALECEVMLNVANHCATFIIDAIDPRGTLDKRVYDRIGSIFSREMNYEPYMNGKAVTDAAIMFFTGGKYNSEGQAVNNKNASIGASTALTERNVLFDVVAGNRADLSKYPTVIAPHIAGATPECINGIVDYVENGGSFYFSGAEEPELISRLLGASFEGMTDYIINYVAPKRTAKKIFGWFNSDYPFPVAFKLPIIKGAASDDILAYITYPYTDVTEDRYASIHSNPPGVATRIPAVVERRVGKGKVIWSAAPIELESRSAYRDIFYNLITELLPEKSRTISSNAPRQVELSVYERESGLQLNAINLFAGDEWLTLSSFKVKVVSKNAPSKVYSVSTGREIPYSYKDGYVEITVKGLKLFEMIEINW
jgi:hypothetical protein